MSFRSTLLDIHGEDASNAALAVKKRDMDPQKIAHIHYVAPGKKPPEAEQTDPNKGNSPSIAARLLIALHTA